MPKPADMTPARNNAFNATPVSTRNKRNLILLTHERRLTADWGELIPTCTIELVPNETIQIGQQNVAQLQAMLAPAMGSVKLKTCYFVVANRLLWKKIDDTGNNWEDYITRGVEGTNAATLPRWNVSTGKHGEGSLWDHIGLPTFAAASDFSTAFPDAVIPHSLFKRAYNLIFNEWFRNQNLQDEVDIDQEDILRANWAADYFTKALPFQQRGVAPAFPISGLSSAVFDGDVLNTYANMGNLASIHFRDANTPGAVDSTATFNPDSAGAGVSDTQAILRTPKTKDTVTAAYGGLDDNVVDFSLAATFNINDLRLNAVIQQLMEINATGGVRYTEFLQAVHGTQPEDFRMQRPEYIGCLETPIIVSEVLQNSATATEPTPLGNKAGKGSAFGQGFVGSYTTKEHCLLIGITFIMPAPAYQQGIPKKFNKLSPYDWFLQQFTGLGEQAVLNQELYLAADGQNQTTFGYEPIYQEYRWEANTVHGKLKSELDYWHYGRKFDARPELDEFFTTMQPAESDELKRVFAVQDEPSFILSIGNIIKALRPMPVIAQPGLFKI